jgi:chromosome segregation ATPase
MNRIISKYGTMALLVILLGLSVFLFVKNTQVKKRNAGLQESIAKTEARENAIKKKYSEEKAKATALQRAKIASDSQIRTLETEVESLQEEMEKARGDQGVVIRGLEKKLETVKSALSELSKEYDAMNDKYAETVENLGKADNEIENLENDLAERRDEIRSLQSELKTALRKIERVVSQNKALAEIGEELLAEFDSQNVFDSLMEKEPFTQAKRVSLESMIQEYLNRIDDEVLTGTDDL